jgi:hypothetical protein
MGQSHKNDDIRTSIFNSCKLDGYSDKVPSEVEDKIRLSIDVNPEHNRFQNVNAYNINAGNFYLTPSDKDFYLCVCSLSVITDITNDATFFAVDEPVTGYIFNMIALSVTTIQNSNNVLHFNPPIKMPRGVNIRAETDGTQGFTARYIISGYTVDPNIYDTGISNNNEEKR